MNDKALSELDELEKLIIHECCGSFGRKDEMLKLVREIKKSIKKGNKDAR